MSITLLIKKNLDSLPPSVGQLLAFIPYKYRPGIGTLYNLREKQIKAFEKLSPKEKKNFFFHKVFKIVEYAYENVPFYKDYYNSKKFNPNKLKSFDHIELIPILNKKLLQKYPLEYRSNTNVKHKYVVNTGGSSGTPFSFYITPQSIAHEWAHMHTIWKKLNYNPKHLKLVFIGRSNHAELIKYDSIRHHYTVNIYKGFEKTSLAIKKLLTKRNIYYLHGYPSAIDEFAIYCQLHDESLLKLLKKNLLGIFYSSEYPNPIIRERVENILGVPSISWYGHTERAILAYEKNNIYEYEPFGTYGYTEGVQIKNKTHLIGTSYYNFASPLIRYDTEDIVDPLVVEQGILRKFTILEGRIGEFIMDSNGEKISLTALIFGRHHNLFDYCSHIQVYQKEQGKAIILYTLIEIKKKIVKPLALFDTSGVQIIFNFKEIDKPIKTKSGKVNLLVKELNI